MSSVARMVNPHLPISETDSYGTVGMEKSIEAKWGYALDAVFPNAADKDDAVAPDLGLQQDALNKLMQEDYREWNDQNSMPEGGVRSLTLVLCAVQQVLGTEYCPPLPDVGKMQCVAVCIRFHCPTLFKCHTHLLTARLCNAES